LANQLLKHNKKVAVIDIGNIIEDKHQQSFWLKKKINS
jgi:hypothetical protein